jgi:hypothetical protein
LLGSVLLSVQNAPGVVLAQALMPRNLGTALGLMNGVGFGLGSLGVAAVGFVVTRSGPDAALAMVSLVPLLAAATYYVVDRRIPDRERYDTSRNGAGIPSSNLKDTTSQWGRAKITTKD